MIRRAQVVSRATRPFITSQHRCVESTKVLLPQSLGVIGAGQMGTGIAYVGAVNAKLPVLLMDANSQSLTKSVNFIST